MFSLGDTSDCGVDIAQCDILQIGIGDLIQHGDTVCLKIDCPFKDISGSSRIAEMIVSVFIQAVEMDLEQR